MDAWSGVPRDLSMTRSTVANLLALGAIGLWGSLAWLGVRLSAVPPFLLVGTALTAAGVLAAPTFRQWRVPPRVLALGVCGLFGYHFCLFMALRLAPPLQANLVNYLWPLLIVLLAPLFIRDAHLTRRHLLGGALGFAGAVVAILNGRVPDATSGTAWSTGAALGYGAALASAFLWATYSLLGQRLRRTGTPFPTAAVGLFCLVSGGLSLVCHAALETPYRFSTADVLPMIVLALGPMGAAFFLWDAAMARGDARTIGTLAYLTPLVSTAVLGLDDPARFGWPIVVALLLVVAGSWIGSRRR